MRFKSLRKVGSLPDFAVAVEETGRRNGFVMDGVGFAAILADYLRGEKSRAGTEVTALLYPQAGVKIYGKRPVMAWSMGNIKRQKRYPAVFRCRIPFFADSARLRKRTST